MIWLTFLHLAYLSAPFSSSSVVFSFAAFHLHYMRVADYHQIVGTRLDREVIWGNANRTQVLADSFYTPYRHQWTGSSRPPYSHPESTTWAEHSQPPYSQELSTTWSGWEYLGDLTESCWLQCGCRERVGSYWPLTCWPEFSEHAERRSTGTGFGVLFCPGGECSPAGSR